MKCLILAILPAIVSLTACISLSGPQKIDTDVAHWPSYAFSEGAVTVTLKVPPQFHTFNPSLPELTYTRSQRRLFDAQYDLGMGGTSFVSEFEIMVHCVKLAAPLDMATLDANHLDAALDSVLRLPMRGPASPPPVEVTIQGRQWIYYDNLNGLWNSDETGETYGTVLNDTTVLLITGLYGPALQKNHSVFESRRLLLKAVRDSTHINQQ